MNNLHKNSYYPIAAAAIINIVLFFSKLYIGLSSNSVAIYADSLNNLLDSGVCLAAVIGLAMLSQKKSKSFPFGTGKAEDLIEFIISVSIIISGCCFGYASVERIFYPMPVWFSVQHAVIIAATAVIKLILSVYLKSVHKKNESGIIKGISADSQMDFFITLCSLISFTLTNRIGYSVDGAAGVIISILMTVQGIKIAIHACSAIMGKNESDMCEKAKKLLESDCSVSHINSVSCHRYGQNRVFTADIETDCETAADIKAMNQRLASVFENELKADIYISFGGLE